MTIPNMNLSEQKYESVEPGGYVVKVVDTFIDQKYNRLQLKVDIAEGPRAGYYTRLQERANFWGLIANLYLSKDSAWKFLKAVDAFRESNADFQWENDGENDERTMIGKFVGAVIQRYHYMGNDGTKKTKMLIHHLVPVDDIHNGKFKIPEDSYAKDFPKEAPASMNVVDTTSEIPAGFTESAEEDPF